MATAIEYNIKTELENNIYTATFSIVNTSEDAKERIKDFGEPQLNIGGDITAEVGGQVETLLKQGDKFIKFTSGLPFTRTFNDAMLGGKAEDIAKAYVAIMEERIKTLVDEIIAKEDDFSDDRDILLP